MDGSSENAAVATSLLTDLVARGLDVEQRVLCVLDGSKALRKAVRDVLGTHTPVQRCVRHKERNVRDHLPERDRELVQKKLRAAWALSDHGEAIERLRALADELARSHPGGRRIAARRTAGDRHHHPPEDHRGAEAHA